MFFFKLKTDDLEKLNELVSLQSQVKALGLQDQFVKQNFHEVTKKVAEPGAMTIKIPPKM